MKQQHDLDEVPTIGEDQFLERCKLTEVGFLKCDIEGSEYALLGPSSRILDISRQIAIEIHKRAGDHQAFIENLVAKGFEVRTRTESTYDMIVLARRSP
jgi:hypothetical protein